MNSTSQLLKAAEQAVRVCVGLKENEEIVIVCDKKHLKEARALEQAASYARTSLLILGDYGKRPLKSVPPQLKKKVKESSATFFIASSLPGELASLRKPLGQFAKQHCRYAHMPNADREVIIKGIGVDNEKVQEFTEKVFREVNGKRRIRVTSQLGTDLSFTLRPDRSWIIFGSILRENGWTNLPGAEVAVCPENAEGVAVIDGVIGDYFVKYGQLENTPVTLSLKNNRVREVECKNHQLEEELRDYLSTDENSDRIGEVAFGTNIFLKDFQGKMIIDEKYPTLHFAAGHPYVAEGEEPPYDSETHVDFLMKSVTAEVDERRVLVNNGEYQIN